MLAEKKAIAVLTTDDLEKSREFYSEKLGIPEKSEIAGGIMLEAGMGSKIYIYERKGVIRPEYTVLGFDVDNIEEEMDELRGKGIVFEEYDMVEIGLKTENGIAEMAGVKSAWFKDPDGNIINIAEMK